MRRKMLRSFVSRSIAAVFVGIAAMLPMAAQSADAVWKGGATGDLNVGPWRNTADTADADITVDVLNFPCDATVTQTVDTAVYNPFGSKTNQTAYKNRNIVFDMGGHTLWATRDDNGQGRHGIQGCLGTTFTFTNGTFRAAPNGNTSKTNTVQTLGNTTDMKIVASGENTTLVASFTLSVRTGLHLKNKAKAQGAKFTIAGSDNEFLVESGASLTGDWVYVGYGNNTNDILRASGEGTTINSRLVVGGDAMTQKTKGNTAILENGATMAGSGAHHVHVNIAGTGNTMSIRSGAKATVNYDVLLGGKSMYDGHNNANIYGECGRLEVVGAGTSLTAGRHFLIRNGTGDASKAQELFIGDGATVTTSSSNGLRIFGDGNKVIISNGTLNINHVFNPNGTSVQSGSTIIKYAATNTTIRIEGANAGMTAKYIRDLDDNQKLAGAPIFEFAIPESGWATAPVVFKEAFSISDDTRIRLDADALKAFLKAGGGTVPLIATDSASKAITADLTKISADLPEGCELTNKDGVIFVTAKPAGLVIFVR